MTVSLLHEKAGTVPFRLPLVLRLETLRLNCFFSSGV